MSWTATAYVKPLRRGLPPKDEPGAEGAALTRSEKFLLFILADYHNEEQKCAYPSGSTLAADALMSLRYVWMLVESLRAKRLICVGKRVSKHGDNATNVYKFHALDCGDDHEGGSELSSLPQRAKRARAGSDLFSLGSDLISLGSEIVNALPSDPPITTPVNPGSLPSEIAGAQEPPINRQSLTVIEPTRTHVAPPAEREPPAAGGGVCVSAELTRKDYQSFARSHNSFTAPDAWVETHWSRRDRDDVVREWLEASKPERVEEARAAPPDERMSYLYAVQVVGSTSSAHAKEPRDVIEELSAAGKIADEVRSKLLQRFYPAGGDS